MLGIKQFTIKKHGKDRLIITYDDTNEGRKLRNNHESFLDRLNNLKFKSSNYSYAYKKDFCTKKALENHMNSIIFIKLDIRNFFDSLTMDKFSKYYPSLLDKDNSINTFKSCFYNNHLAIGFVTSPKLSDIFMYDFDSTIETYLNKKQELKYSRYCDDILISSSESNFIILRKFKSFIIDELNKLDFEINDAKTKEFDLRYDTSVSFLGLNLSKGNKITVSKTIILKPINLYAKYKHILSSYKKVKGEEKEKIKSKLAFKKSIILSYVHYIHYVSEDYSFPRFKKKFNNYFKIEWNEKILDI